MDKKNPCGDRNRMEGCETHRGAGELEVRGNENIWIKKETALLGKGEQTLSLYVPDAKTHVYTHTHTHACKEAFMVEITYHLQHRKDHA